MKYLDLFIKPWCLVLGTTIARTNWPPTWSVLGSTQPRMFSSCRAVGWLGQVLWSLWGQMLLGTRKYSLYIAASIISKWWSLTLLISMISNALSSWFVFQILELKDFDFEQRIKFLNFQGSTFHPVHRQLAHPEAPRGRSLHDAHCWQVQWDGHRGHW